MGTVELAGKSVSRPTRGELTSYPWSWAAARGANAGLHHAVVIKWVTSDTHYGRDVEF